MEFHEILAVIMAENNLSVPDVAKKCGLSDSTVRSIFDRKQKKIALNVAFKLANGLGVSLQRLNGMPEEPDTIPATPAPQKQKPAASKPDTAANIANRYGRLDDHGKRTVCAVVSEEERRIQALQKTDPEDNVIRVHWNDQPASAGEGFDLSDEHMHRWTVRYNELTRKADFCLDVQGHSMEPKFHDGDTVLVRQQPSVDIGEIGLFIMDGKGYIKKQGPDRLISLNPDYNDVWPNEFSDFRCVGKVIGVLKPEWIISR